MNLAAKMACNDPLGDKVSTASTTPRDLHRPPSSRMTLRNAAGRHEMTMDGTMDAPRGSQQAH